MDEKEFKQFVSGVKIFLKDLAKSAHKQFNKNKITTNLKNGVYSIISIVVFLVFLSIIVSECTIWIALLPIQFIVYIFNKKNFRETYPQKLVSKIINKVANTSIDKIVNKITGRKNTPKSRKSGGKKHGSKGNRNKQDQAKSVTG